MGILSPEIEALIIRQASLRGGTPDALVRRLLETEAPPPPGPPTIGLEAVRAMMLRALAGTSPRYASAFTVFETGVVMLRRQVPPRPMPASARAAIRVPG